MDIREQLEKAQMPVPLRADALCEKVYEKFEKKLESAKGLMFDNTPVVFLIGNDSPHKDSFAASLMKAYMIQKNKTGRWCLPPRSNLPIEEVGVAGVSTIISLDLYTQTAAKSLAAILRDAIVRGRAFIICCSSGEIAEELFGKEFMAFVSHQSALIDVGVPRAEIVEI